LSVKSQFTFRRTCNGLYGLKFEKRKFFKIAKGYSLLLTDKFGSKEI
jgi:hypothetical protein